MDLTGELKQFLADVQRETHEKLPVEPTDEQLAVALETAGKDLEADKTVEDFSFYQAFRQDMRERIG